jgi:hypothetical protein
MAIPKAINKKSYYGSEGAGDIAMPPLDQTPPISQAAPDPWNNQQSQSAQNNPFGAVPDAQEAQNLAHSIADQDADNVETTEESTRDEMSQVEESVRDEMSQPEETPSKPSPKESFRLVREAKERAERERDAMLSQMLAMQQQMQLQQQQQQPQIPEQPQEDYDFDIEADALAEGKHLKKLMAKQKAMEQQLKRYQVQSEEVAVEARIRAQYPDFEKVVSKENVDILRQQFPEIAATLHNTPDMYNKAAAAYTVIKNFGIHKDTPKFEADRAKAVSNATKPRPLASVNPTQGDSPLSKANAFANGMTDELKEQLRKEMYNARKAM